MGDVHKHRAGTIEHPHPVKPFPMIVPLSVTPEFWLRPGVLEKTMAKGEILVVPAPPPGSPTAWAVTVLGTLVRLTDSEDDARASANDPRCTQLWRAAFYPVPTDGR